MIKLSSAAWWWDVGKGVRQALAGHARHTDMHYMHTSILNEYASEPDAAPTTTATDHTDRAPHAHIHGSCGCHARPLSCRGAPADVLALQSQPM